MDGDIGPAGNCWSDFAYCCNDNSFGMCSAAILSATDGFASFSGPFSDRIGIGTTGRAGSCMFVPFVFFAVAISGAQSEFLKIYLNN